MIVNPLSALERFALIQLLLEREGGSLTITTEDVARLAESHDGWAAVVFIRPEGLTFRAVSPERRQELLAMGFVERG